MKLYFSPGACSMSIHIILREAGFTFDTDKVDLATKKTASGQDYMKINPKGYVPALEMENGQILTENTAIAQYLADQKPNLKLSPEAGTLEHYRLIEWLGFISTEIHKNIGRLFSLDNPEIREKQVVLIKKRFDYLESELKNKLYLMGDNFSIADSYLFTTARWCQTEKVNIDLNPWPNLKKYLQNIAERPAVKAAMEAERLI